MKQIKMIKEYLEYQEIYYYTHTHLLDKDYHKGKYDMVVKLLEYLDDFKHIKVIQKDTLDCLKGDKRG